MPYNHLIIQGAWGRGSWRWLSMSFYVAIGCQLWANAYSSNQPIWTQPKVSRGYTEHKHQCSDLVWAHGPQYAPPAAAYTWGSVIGGKVAIWKLPSLSRCGNLQPDFLDSTKCFEPTYSDYCRPWKHWLASETSIGGAGGGTKMGFCTENPIFSAKLPFWGLCSNPQPTYLNPTKCFEPTYSDYSRPWKHWSASETLIGGTGGGPKMALGLSCCPVPKGYFHALVAPARMHIWTQPSVFNEHMVHVLDIENFGGHRKPW